MSMVSVNRTALTLVKKLIEQRYAFGVKVEKTGVGATLIDAGVDVKGGYDAGVLITEVCMGGFGKAHLFNAQYGDVSLPSIFVSTDHPAVATLGAQYAGWRIKVGDFYAMGSGPARALALEPASLYKEIEYGDVSEVAIVLLEVDKKPGDDVLRFIADECVVQPENLYVLITPTSSLAGAVQISGRVVETGVHKLHSLGFNPRSILHGCGYAPVASIHPKFARAMGRTNDVILYAGVTFYTVDYEDDVELANIVAKTPSSASRDYGRLFNEVFKAANYDFYKIDPHLFAPAMVTINNIKTGNVYSAGKVNVEVLKRSMGLS